MGSRCSAWANHIAAWRHPDVPVDGSMDFRHFLRVTTPNAENSTSCSWPASSRSAAATIHPARQCGKAMAMMRHIGLVATGSTTYSEPSTSRANCSRSIISAAATRGGTWSPPAARRMPSTSGMFWAADNRCRHGRHTFHGRSRGRVPQVTGHDRHNFGTCSPHITVDRETRRPSSTRRADPDDGQDNIATHRVLMLVTFRPEFVAPGIGRSHACRPVSATMSWRRTAPEPLSNSWQPLRGPLWRSRHVCPPR